MYNSQHVPTELVHNGVTIQNPHLLPMLRHTGTMVRVHPAPKRAHADRPTKRVARQRRPSAAREALTQQALRDARAWAERQGK